MLPWRFQLWVSAFVKAQRQFFRKITKKGAIKIRLISMEAEDTQL